MNAIIFIAIVIVAVGITAVIAFIASYFEYKGWNGGVCPRCGKPLRYFDTDSQGGEGWTCDGCNYTAWVSYHRMVYRFWNRRENKNLIKDGNNEKTNI